MLGIGCVKKWLNGQTVESKLEAGSQVQNEEAESLCLFHYVRNRIGIYSHEESVERIEEVRSKYKDPDFVKVSHSVL